MRKTNKELAEFYGIKVGDNVRIYYGGSHEMFKVVFHDSTNNINLTSSTGGVYSPSFIGDCKYEVIKPKKKLGETKCTDYETCQNCPLDSLACGSFDSDSLYGTLDTTFSRPGLSIDHPAYAVYKAMLDKEVE